MLQGLYLQAVYYAPPVFFDGGYASFAVTACREFTLLDAALSNPTLEPNIKVEITDLLCQRSEKAKDQPPRCCSASGLSEPERQTQTPYLIIRGHASVLPRAVFMEGIVARVVRRRNPPLDQLRVTLLLWSNQMEYPISGKMEMLS